MAEAFAVWAGATEEDGITLRQWLQQRPHQHGSHNFLGFHEEDECEGSLEEWEADYRAEMAAAGLGLCQEPPNSAMSDRDARRLHR